MKIITFLLILLFFFLPFTRCFIFSFPKFIKYFPLDIYHFFKFQKYNDFNYFGIDMFCGMFGTGKTLSMTKRAIELYNKYGDDIQFYSNYELVDIPYIPLVNFSQLVDIGEDDSRSFKGTVVLIDEIENVLNNRNYANFPLPMLHMLTQQRKKRVYIMCSSQRFFMVDKLFRSITTNVYLCKKIWRFQNQKKYDAWELENAVNPSLIKNYGSTWFFVTDNIYHSYDTSEMVKKNSSERFIANWQILQNQGIVSALPGDNIIHKRVKKK